MSEPPTAPAVPAAVADLAATKTFPAAAPPDAPVPTVAAAVAVFDSPPSAFTTAIVNVAVGTVFRSERSIVATTSSRNISRPRASRCLTAEGVSSSAVCDFRDRLVLPIEED